MALTFDRIGEKEGTRAFKTRCEEENGDCVVWVYG